MAKEKKHFKIRCPDCDQEIIGFSEHHAKMNLLIHQKTSVRCEQIKKLLKKKGIK